MGHEELRTSVCEANRGLVEAGLVVLSFGNASGIDRGARIVAIKPSGVDSRRAQAVLGHRRGRRGRDQRRVRRARAG